MVSYVRVVRSEWSGQNGLVRMVRSGFFWLEAVGSGWSGQDSQVWAVNVRVAESGWFVNDGQVRMIGSG